MKKWTKYPHEQSKITYAGAALKKAWPALHAGDGEPFPEDEQHQAAWTAFHAGNFAEAAEQGLGETVQMKATNIYATHLESRQQQKLELYQEVMRQADLLRVQYPKDPNVHYQYAYAAGRYSQGISVLKALKAGYGGKIKSALETTLKLNPQHAEAHTAMGAYHSEIIDKVGAMAARLTYGASKELAFEHFEYAVKINPKSPIALIEHANGILLLMPEQEDRAVEMYVAASKMKGRDAMEVLDAEMARNELED